MIFNPFLSFNIGDQLLLNPNPGEKMPIRALREYDTIGGFISAVLPNIYAFASIILFLVMIAGGFMFILGSNNDDPRKADQGKQAITSSLIGFLIIFTSFWIIRIIEIITGLDIFKSGV
jgi:hypothetical protein